MQVIRPAIRHGRERFKRRFAGAMRLLAVTGFACLVVRLYQWAEPKPRTFASIGILDNSPDLALRLDRSAYTNYFGGEKSWSLWARQIDLMRPPGNAGLTNLERAEVTDIRSGMLYDLPDRAGASAQQDKHHSSAPAATFSATQGHYVIGMPLSAPPDLQLNYRVQWQFQLTGIVRLRTRQGDLLSSPALTIIQLTNLRNGKQERRILCDEGVEVTVKNIQVHANSVRYDPELRRVECIGGVRGVLPRGHARDTVQAERLFWSLPDQTILCTETATGMVDGMRFTTDGVTIDIRRHLFEGSQLHLGISSGGVDTVAARHEQERSRK